MYFWLKTKDPMQGNDLITSFIASAGAHKTSLITLLLAAQAMTATASDSEHKTMAESDHNFTTPLILITILLATLIFIVFKGITCIISLFKTPAETNTSKAKEPRIEFPEFKLALTEAEMCNLLIALSYTCFTEGVHSGRTFCGSL